MVERPDAERVRVGLAYTSWFGATLDELMIQVLNGTATPSQRERVQRWRAESPENEAYYERTLTVWSATEPEPLGVLLTPVSPQAIVAAAEERRRAEAVEGVVPIGKRPWLRMGGRLVLGWSLAAAAALVGLALGIGRSGNTAAPTVLATFDAQEAVRTVGLEDGSFVRLAPGATLRVLGSEGQRRVQMTGRAFFAVSHDQARPFVVSLGGVETRVLGTRFEVAEQDGGLVRAIVVEGRVALANGLGSVEVPAGGGARASDDISPVALAVEDVYGLLDWPGGLMLYQGTPLARVAEEVGRYYGRVVEVEGESLRALRITGSFENQAFEEVVLALCEASGAACGLNDAGASIAPRP